MKRHASFTHARAPSKDSTFIKRARLTCFCGFQRSVFPRLALFQQCFSTLLIVQGWICRFATSKPCRSRNGRVLFVLVFGHPFCWCLLRNAKRNNNLDPQNSNLDIHMGGCNPKCLVGEFRLVVGSFEGPGAFWFCFVFGDGGALKQLHPPR